MEERMARVKVWGKRVEVVVFIAIVAALGVVAFVGGQERWSVNNAGGAASTSKGGYHALIIGNNDYKHMSNLKTAVNDAKAVEQVLRGRYGFNTRLLVNATRAQILSTLNEFRRTLGEDDNFLVYYAGHGKFDEIAGKAYWLPVDAKRDDTTEWIIADDITSEMKRIASKHILLVSDSCYSGTLTRGASTDLSSKGRREEFLRKMMERRSRTLMASGGNEPVSDSGGGEHSVFAAAFLRALKEVDKGTFTAEELFYGGKVKESVGGKSEQLPEYNNIRNSGHDGGDFVFNLGDIYPTPVPTPIQTPVPTASPTLAISSTYTDPMTEMEFVLVKGGCYDMGDTLDEGHSNEKPVHKVCVDDFYMSRYEVTQAQWEKVMGSNPSKGGRYPVELVSWDDAQGYLSKLNQQTDKKHRLPTEAEWEYACREGGKKVRFGTGTDKINSGIVNFDASVTDKQLYSEAGEYRNQTTEVGSLKKANGLGLYDMSGNVWEWVEDWYSEDAYKQHDERNPIYTKEGSNRVLRGGSWSNRPQNVRCAVRFGSLPGSRRYSIGFRLVRSM
ncbi:peptidase C14, caspase catalytic subunit p20 [Candidatus Magnetobacterium bavaricum]|uniref:Peptidase C14, caspase catalytic subunit p20 n=1 Tax=Candidatus Magnetobacterium bavaricum TaxID=29290 RepID=A0A0F3GRE3_9BACT|nr:peptidase C14, caspase catalytic subunit p20 [Candidatus Magnetobacterium bavaricum]